MVSKFRHHLKYELVYMKNFALSVNTDSLHATFPNFIIFVMTTSSQPSSEAAAASTESPVSPSELAAAARAFSAVPGPPNRFVCTRRSSKPFARTDFSAYSDTAYSDTGYSDTQVTLTVLTVPHCWPFIT